MTRTPVAMRSAFADWLACCAGATAVETALVFPVLSLVLYGSMELARALSLHSSLQYAVERAARCAVVKKASTCDNAADTAAYASTLVYGATVSSGNFTVTYPPTSTCGVSVAASFRFTPLAPFGMSYNLTALECRPYS